MSAKRKLLSIVLFSSLLAPLFATGYEEKLHTIVYNACSETNGPPREAQLAAIIKRIPNPSGWDVAVEAIIYRACFLEYQSWLTGHSFNLAYYGHSQGLQKETLESLTELMSIQTFGKKDYLEMGKIWELLKKSGATDYTLSDFMQRIIMGRYRGESVEAIAIVYANYRSSKMEHANAFEKATDDLKDVLNSRNPEAIFAWALFHKAPEELKEEGLENIDWEKQKKRFWEKTKFHPERNKYKGYSKLWKPERFLRFFQSWEGVSYLYGGSSKRGIDSLGFIRKAFLDQNPETDLPENVEELAKMGRRVSQQSLKTGDLLFFSASQKKGKITDVAIYLGDNEFAHSTSERGLTRSSLEDEYYSERFVVGKRLY